MATQRIYVSGRVQAVGFRDWVVRNAKALGLIGWVRNRVDGRVEIVASGDDDAIAKLAEECLKGPALARVDNVDSHPAPDAKPGKGFTKHFTA